MHCDPLAAYAYRWFGMVAIATIDRSFEWFWRHLRRLDASFDLVVSASDDLPRRSRDRWAGARSQTIPMGVSPGYSRPPCATRICAARCSTQCGLPADATLLVGVGRMAPEKRWPMVSRRHGGRHRTMPVGLVLFGAGRDRARVLAHVARVAACAIVAPASPIATGLAAACWRAPTR
jgi:alpha-1,6-mannosyltransferase